MKYFVVVFKLSLIFLLAMLHLSFVKQWLHSVSEQPISIKSTTISPVMVHFIATIPPAPPLPMPVPDKKPNMKMMLPKSEVKQQQKLNKLPILPTRIEKAISPQKVQKSSVPAQKKLPVVSKEKLPEKPPVVEKAVEKPATTASISPQVETQTTAAPAAPVEQPTKPVSQISSNEHGTDSKMALMPKNAIFQSNSLGKSTGQSIPTTNQLRPYTPPNHHAAYLHNPKPHYPEISQQLEEQGTVQLLVNVDSRGQVSQARIKHSSGYPRLDSAALQAVKQWQFIPAKQGDKPIAATTLVPITFRLDEE